MVSRTKNVHIVLSVVWFWGAYLAYFPTNHLLKIIKRVKIKIRIQSIFQLTSIYLKRVGTFENLTLSVRSVSFSEPLSCFSRMWSALGEKIPGYRFAQHPRSQALILGALALLSCNWRCLLWSEHFPDLADPLLRHQVSAEQARSGIPLTSEAAVQASHCT